jgi:hypothetical protein
MASCLFRPEMLFLMSQKLSASVNEDVAPPQILRPLWASILPAIPNIKD